MQAYLFLPKNALPPFQTVIHFPPGGGPSSRQLPMRFLDFIIRSGRAVMFPVYLGMFERRGSAATGPNGERDRTIAWSKDLGRSIDYLETRRDIDRRRIAYYGFSLGGIVGPILTALEPRFRRASFWVGAWSPCRRLRKSNRSTSRARAHADADGERQTGFRETDRDAAAAAFQSAGTAARPEALRAVRGGHIPRLQDIIREMLDWLDRYLGRSRLPDAHRGEAQVRHARGCQAGATWPLNSSEESSLIVT